MPDGLLQSLSEIGTAYRGRVLCLRDPGDDLVLELAVASRSRTIVTFNKRDFTAAEGFGIEILVPSENLRKIGVS